VSQLPQGWAEASIADVTMPFASIDPTKTPEQEFRYADIGSIDNKTQTITDPKFFLGHDAPSRARRLIRAGDTLFSTVRTYLKNIALVPEDLDGELTSTGIAVLRPSDAVDAGYLFRWACSDDFVAPLSSAQDGTMYPAVSDRDVAAAPIPLPPLPEQRRIVAKIDSLTGKSRRARDHLDHIPRLVEKYKQAVLARLLSSPDGQQVARFGDVANLLNGDRGQHYPNDSEQLLEGYCLFLGTRNVRQGFFDFSETSFITREKHFALRGGTMERGDIVVTVRGTLGNCAVYDASVPFDLVRINSAMMIVRPIADADPEYLMWTIRSPVFLGWVGANARGSAQPHLRARDIEQTKVYFPSIERQQETVQRIKHAFKWIDRLASEATSARRLIDRLDQAVLAKAFRGELVPQDPDDEPASVLLKRIRAERSAAPKAKRGRKAKAA
jgi:type I restriction enzyme S subunit